MSLGLNKTKRRIASITSTQKITKAMGMVATVKLKRFRDVVEQGRAYSEGLREVMAEICLHDNEARSHYSLENEEVEPVLYLVITSNLGLCAGYNNNVFKFVEEHVNPAVDTIVPLGEKGKHHFAHDPRYQHINTAYPDLDKTMNSRLIDKACREIKTAFNERKYRKVVLIYTKYVNSMTFVPTMETLLPVQLEDPKRPEESFCPPIFEPNARTQIHVLMPYYLGSVLYHKISEAQLCEQASRRNAMDNANDNADELLRKLTIEYNKARQTAITQEIVEVVSGSANAGNR